MSTPPAILLFIALQCARKTSAKTVSNVFFFLLALAFGFGTHGLAIA
jgi:hypothetical protein